jgi:hypothetical protein
MGRDFGMSGNDGDGAVDGDGAIDKTSTAGSRVVVDVSNVIHAPVASARAATLPHKNGVSAAWCRTLLRASASATLIPARTDGERTSARRD